jgi:hypothetical protein
MIIMRLLLGQQKLWEIEVKICGHSTRAAFILKILQFKFMFRFKAED